MLCSFALLSLLRNHYIHKACMAQPPYMVVHPPFIQFAHMAHAALLALDAEHFRLLTYVCHVPCKMSSHASTF